MVRALAAGRWSHRTIRKPGSWERFSLPLDLAVGEAGSEAWVGDGFDRAHILCDLYGMLGFTLSSQADNHSRAWRSIFKDLQSPLNVTPPARLHHPMQ